MNALNQTNITQLTVNSVPLYDNGMSGLCRMLKSNKKITHLYLMHLRTNDYSELGEALAENTTVKSLYIRMSFRRQSNIGLHSIAKGLGSNTSIERLKISYVELTAFEAICNALQTNHKIEALEFQEGLDPLNPNCLVALRTLLETNKTLVKLSLERCKINQDATAAICEVLTGNSTLKELVLDGNNLSSSACSALAQLLKRNTSLKRLSLTNNSVAVCDGMNEICKSLLENNTLEWLDLRGNAFDGHHYPTLKQVFGRNTSLSRLDLEDPNFNYYHMELLANELRQNKTLHTVALKNASDESVASFWVDILSENEILINVGAFSKAVPREMQFQITEYLVRNRRQQNTRVQNVIITLFNIARDQENCLPIELWFHVCKFIEIPGVAIDWHDLFRKMFENKSQLKVLHPKYL